MLKITAVIFMATAWQMASAFTPDACQQGNDEEKSLCAKQNYEQQDQRLNTLYKQINKTLTTDNKQALKVAQRAWLKYRDSHCYAQQSQQPKNIQTLCLAQQTYNRIQELLQVYNAPTSDKPAIKEETLLGSWQTTANEYGLKMTFGVKKGVHYFISHLNELPFEVGQWQLNNGQLNIMGNDGQIIRSYHQIEINENQLNLFEIDGGLEQYQKTQ